MDKNLVVSLDEIKGIRLQCKECGSEVVISPTNSYYVRACPQGHPWQDHLSSQKRLHLHVPRCSQAAYRVTPAVQGRSIGV